MVDNRKIKSMIKRSKSLKWCIPQCTSKISSSKKHCMRQETIFPITEGRDIRRGTSIVKKKKGCITSQYQSCFRNFSGRDIKRQFKYTHEDGSGNQNRVLDHKDMVRNGRPEKQSQTHDSSNQNDFIRTVHDQTISDKSQINTSYKDKPISPSQSSVKEIILSCRIPVSSCNKQNMEIKESTKAPPLERSLFDDLKTCLDSFKVTCATSCCQAKPCGPHLSTVNDNTSNKTLTNVETSKKTMKRTVGEETDFVSDNEVINGEMKQYNPTSKDNFKNWLKHCNTLKENNVSEKRPIRKESKHEHLKRACSLSTFKHDRIHTKNAIETASKKECNNKESAADYLPPKKRFCFSLNHSPTKNSEISKDVLKHSPTKNSEISKDVLKSILKSPRSAFKHNVSPRKQMVSFAEDVPVVIKDKEQGLMTTPKQLLSNSSDVIKTTSSSSTRKRPRPKLTGAQIKLAEIVKRLKMDRINGKKYTEDKVIPKSNTVSCASSLLKHFQGKNLTILIEAPHKKKKSASRVVKSSKIDVRTTASVLGNNSPSQRSPVTSAKEVVTNASICQPSEKTPQKEMLSPMKEREIVSHITSVLKNIHSSSGGHLPCTKEVVTDTAINKQCGVTPPVKMVSTEGKEIDKCNTLIPNANSSGKSLDTVVVAESIYKPCQEKPSSMSEHDRGSGCAKEVVADTFLLKGGEIQSSKVTSEKTENITHNNRSHQKSSIARTKLTSIRLFPCHLCHKKFISPAKLESHKPTHNTWSPSLEFALSSIDDSPDKVERRVALNDVEQEHQENHLESRDVKECEINYVTDNSREDSTEIDSKDVGLHGLKIACNSGTDLSHIRERKTNGTKQCTHCNRKFKNIENLKRHEQAHAMEKEHACAYCKETFSLSSERNKHERTHGIKETCSCEE